MQLFNAFYSVEFIWFSMQSSHFILCIIFKFFHLVDFFSSFGQCISFYWMCPVFFIQCIWFSTFCSLHLFLCIRSIVFSSMPIVNCIVFVHFLCSEFWSFHFIQFISFRAFNSVYFIWCISVNAFIQCSLFHAFCLCIVFNAS